MNSAIITAVFAADRNATLVQSGHYTGVSFMVDASKWEAIRRDCIWALGGDAESAGFNSKDQVMLTIKRWSK